ncbi:uncharacterized [Tachysurus ichikawai]
MQGRENAAIPGYYSGYLLRRSFAQTTRYQPTLFQHQYGVHWEGYGSEDVFIGEYQELLLGGVVVVVECRLCHMSTCNAITKLP